MSAYHKDPEFGIDFKWPKLPPDWPFMLLVLILGALCVYVLLSDFNLWQ